MKKEITANNIEDNAVALRVLIAAAKDQPHNAPTLWQAARMILNHPVALASALTAAHRPASEGGDGLSHPAKTEQDISALKAEFDYADENGLHSHRTVILMALTDGRDVKRNTNVPVADRYGYLLTGYCTLRKQIRSFRSSRISNLRTFIEGSPEQPNRQWFPQRELESVAIAS